MALTKDQIYEAELRWLDPTPETEEQPAKPGRYVLNVRRADRILDDGKVVHKSYHREVVETDSAEMDKQPEIVQELAAAVEKMKK